MHVCQDPTSVHIPVFKGQTVFGVNPPTQLQTGHSLQWAFQCKVLGVQSQPFSMLTFLYLELYSISLEYSASPPPPKMVVTFLQQVLWNVGSPPHPTTISSVSTPPPPQPTHIHTHLLPFCKLTSLQWALHGAWQLPRGTAPAQQIERPGCCPYADAKCWGLCTQSLSAQCCPASGRKQLLTARHKWVSQNSVHQPCTARKSWPLCRPQLKLPCHQYSTPSITVFHSFNTIHHQHHMPSTQSITTSIPSRESIYHITFLPHSPSPHHIPSIQSLTTSHSFHIVYHHITFHPYSPSPHHIPSN